MDYRETAGAIKALKIQGAQQIALAGAKSLSGCRSIEELKRAAALLEASRPTEPSLRNALGFILSGFSKVNFQRQLKDKIAHVENYFEKANQEIAMCGARLIKQGFVVFTHCHSSAVMGILIKARHNGIKFIVHNTETRPFFQGRVTAKELARENIEVVHFVDSAARQALKKADLMLVGADAITSEGFVVNKVGTEMYAEVANSYQIPVYVCTPSWKFDGKTKFGFEVELEERYSKEVWDKPPRGVRISNVVFDKTHPRLITGIVSEFGVTTLADFIDQVKSTYEWIV